VVRTLFILIFEDRIRCGVLRNPPLLQERHDVNIDVFFFFFLMLIRVLLLLFLHARRLLRSLRIRRTRLRSLLLCGHGCNVGI